MQVKPSDLLGSLEETARRLDDEPLSLPEPGNFGTLYSAVKHFASLSPELREHAQGLIGAALERATLACKRSVNALGSDSELTERRQLLGMAVFLQSWLVREAEKLAAKALPTKAPAAEQKKGGKKGAKSKEWVWADEREGAFLRLLQALELELGKLWEHRAPDDAFLLLFSRAAHAVLEQPAATKAATAALKDILWKLIALPVERYNQGEATMSTLLEMLLTHEHLAAPLAELMQRMLEEHDGVPHVKALLSELATLEGADMGADAVGPKNLAAFLTALAAREPLFLLSNAELVRAHLEAESHQLRCGAVSACAELLIQAVDLDPAARREPLVADAIETLREVPLTRLHDTSAYVRARALHCLVSMCEGKALPLGAFAEVAELGLRRLDDKNANVRSPALQLYRALLEFNPVLPSLNRPQLEVQRERLRQMLPPPTPAAEPEPEPQPAAEPADDGAEGEAGAAATTPEEETAAVVAAPPVEPKPLNETEKALQLIEQALELEAVLQARLGGVTVLLGSQTASDVKEACRALETAHTLALDGANPAELLVLVWSREESVKRAALESYQKVWLPQGRGADHASGVAASLLALVEGATLAQATSLEQVVAEWHAQQLLPKALVSTLWDVCRGQHGQLRDAAHRRAALALLNMAAAADAALLRGSMDVLIEQLRAPDLAMVRHACVGLRRCAAAAPLPAHAVRPVVHALEEVVLRAPPAAQADAWLGAAEEAVATLYAVCPAPVEVSSELIRQLSARAFPTVVRTAADADADAAEGGAATESDGDATVDSGAAARAGGDQDARRHRGARQGARQDAARALAQGRGRRQGRPRRGAAAAAGRRRAQGQGQRRRGGGRCGRTAGRRRGRSGQGAGHRLEPERKALLALREQVARAGAAGARGAARCVHAARARRRHQRRRFLWRSRDPRGSLREKGQGQSRVVACVHSSRVNILHNTRRRLHHAIGPKQRLLSHGGINLATLFVSNALQLAQVAILDFFSLFSDWFARVCMESLLASMESLLASEVRVPHLVLDGRSHLVRTHRRGAKGQAGGQAAGGRRLGPAWHGLKRLIPVWRVPATGNALHRHHLGSRPSQGLQRESGHVGSNAATLLLSPCLELSRVAPAQRFVELVLRLVLRLLRLLLWLLLLHDLHRRKTLHCWPPCVRPQPGEDLLRGLAGSLVPLVELLHDNSSQTGELLPLVVG